jgi:hypothetical protein
MTITIDLRNVQKAQNLISDCYLYKLCTTWISTNVVNVNEEEIAFDILDCFNMFEVGYTITETN